MIKYEKCHVLWLVSFLGIFLFIPALVNAGEFFVDTNNTTGTEDGTSKHPYNTIQEAIALATGGGEHTVRVAQGDYTGNVDIDTVTVHLLGGFLGGTPADYAGGTGGVFDTQDPVAHVTRIQGDGTGTVVRLQGSGASTLDGFVITGGTGLTDSYRYMGGGVYVAEGSPTVSRNVIEGNNTRHEGFISRGGGIAVENSNAHIIGNTVRNNISGLGGGISVNGGDVVIQGNRVQNNTATEDHGGGLYVSGNSLTITNNRVLDNEVGQIAGYGWGGGIAVIGQDTTATLSYNHFSGNFAPTAGGGVFLDDGATVVVSHELIHQNGTQERGGTGVYVDGFGDEIGTTVTMSHCTIAENLCSGGGQLGGNGLLVEYYSVVTVQDSIFWGNGGDDFYADETSQISVTYTDSEETVSGRGNISSNPRFTDAAGNDFHLQSTTGRWDPAAGSGTGAWVSDLNQSPCIDKGSHQSGFANEPMPNGNRINMGCYGNTKEASKSGLAIGDVNGNLNIDMTDAVLALQVLSGVVPSSPVYKQADVNGDDRIGLEGAIYILQGVAGVRPLFRIQSSAFNDSDPIPSKYTCDSGDVSPPLSWQNLPAGTQSFVLIMDDPDAPGGTWDHWIVYDIPPSVTSLAENAGTSGGGNLPSGAIHGTNSWPNTYYQGPCPPSGTHRYFFKLYSLSVSQLNPSGTSKAEIEAAMAGKTLGQTELMGTYTFTP